MLMDSQELLLQCPGGRAEARKSVLFSVFYIYAENVIRKSLNTQIQQK